MSREEPGSRSGSGPGSDRDGGEGAHGSDGDGGSRSRRWLGFVRVGLARARAKGTRVHPRRTAATVAGVAVAVALMVVVTGVALGLASGATVAGDDVDYWIVPEEGSASSLVVSTEGPRLGGVHGASASLSNRSDVRYATPVLVEVLRLAAGEGSGDGGDGQNGTSDREGQNGTGTGNGGGEYVLAVGVVAGPSVSVAGVPAESLAEGDPYYADGSYDGTWTGEAVLSPAAATLLDADVGTQLTPTVRGGDRSFSVVGVDRAAAKAGVGDLPVALVHLGELQVLAGAEEGDQADQVLVAADETGLAGDGGLTGDGGLADDLSAVYPRSTVLTRQGLTTAGVTSGLPLAIGLSALAVAVVVGTLFVATNVGLEIRADRREYAVMRAVGVSGVSQSLVVATRTLALALLGGLAGVTLGYVGIAVANAVAGRTLAATAGQGPVARAHPALAGYGLAVAVLIGALAVPYLLWQARRTNAREALRW